MKKRNYTLRTIISITFIAIIIVTFSVSGYFVFSSWKTSADNIISKMENDAIDDIVSKIDQFVNLPLTLNEANHYLIQKHILDLNNKEQREIYFAGVIKSNPEEVYSYSYGTEQGEYYGARRNEKNEIEIMQNDSTTDGKSQYYALTQDLTAGQLVEETGKFDSRSRDWYRMAKAEKKPVFSSIYRHFVMNDLAISAAYPIYDPKGVLQGVLGTHIILSKINTYLSQIVKDKRADAYIIEKNTGELIANSLNQPNFVTLADNTFKRINIKEIRNESIRNAYQNYMNQSVNNSVVNTDTDKVHINITNYKKESLDWLIITSIPESQFTLEINRSIQVSLLLSIVALIFSILVYIRFTDMMLNPIYNLIHTAEKFSQGDFLQRARIYRDDEVGKLSSAFNKMAEELDVLIHSLEEKVKDRTSEIEKTNTRLVAAKMESENANQAKSEFLAYMSHDMKTPLTIISLFAQELKEAKIGTLNEAQKAAVENILFGSNQLITIVENLLDLTKLNSIVKSFLILNEVEVSSLATEVANGMNSVAQTKNIRLKTTINDTCLIIADQRMVKRVMQNLLDNAIKFSKYGDEIEFIVSKTDHPEEGVFIEVIDNGKGIAKNMQESIFDRFFQIRNGEQEHLGTGLGLTVVKKIVEAHCGTISVISEEGHGARFIVFLPTLPKLDEEVE